MIKVCIRSSLSRSVALLCCTFILLSGCDRSVKVNEDGIISEYTVVVKSSAGDNLAGFGASGVPSFFNYGEMKLEGSEHEFIVLGPRLEKGDKVPVKILGALEFEMDTTKVTWYVSERFPGDKSGEEASRDEGRFLSYQSAIESWIRMQCQLKDCRAFNWKLPIHLFRKTKERELQE